MGDHVGELALICIAVGINPVVHALDLVGVGAVVGELVQPDELRHRLEGKVVHHKARQGHGGQRGTAHRHGKHQRKGPVEKLELPVLPDAFGQCGRTGEEQQQPSRHEQQHLVGTGVLHPGEQHKAYQQLHTRKTGQGRQTAFCGKPQPHPDEDEVQQADAQGLRGQLQRDAAEVVVGVAPGVIEAEDLAHHGQQKQHHGPGGAQAEHGQPDEAVHSPGLLAAFCQPHTGHCQQQDIGEAVAHHKV